MASSPCSPLLSVDGIREVVQGKSNVYSLYELLNTLRSTDAAVLRNVHQPLIDVLLREAVLSGNRGAASRSLISRSVSALLSAASTGSSAALASELLASCTPAAACAPAALNALAQLLHSFPSSLRQLSPLALEASVKCYCKLQPRAAVATRLEALRCCNAAAMSSQHPSPKQMNEAVACVRKATASNERTMLRRTACQALQRILPLLVKIDALHNSNNKILSAAVSLMQHLLQDTDAYVGELAAYCVATHCRALCNSLSSDCLPVNKLLGPDEAALYAARVCFVPQANAATRLARSRLCIGWINFIRDASDAGIVHDDGIISLAEQVCMVPNSNETKRLEAQRHGMLSFLHRHLVFLLDLDPTLHLLTCMLRPVYRT